MGETRSGLEEGSRRVRTEDCAFGAAMGRETEEPDEDGADRDGRVCRGGESMEDCGEGGEALQADNALEKVSCRSWAVSTHFIPIQII